MSFTLLLLVLGALSALAIVVFTRRRDLILVALLPSFIFSGAVIDELGQVGDGVRQLTIVMLGVLGLSRVGELALGQRLILASLLIGVAIQPVREAPSLGVLFAVFMVLLHGPVAASLTVFLSMPGRDVWFGRAFVGVAILHNLFSLSGLGDFEGDQRFAGGGTSSPIFAFTGAVLVSALLWCAIYQEGIVRFAGLCLAPPTVLFTLLGAQRSGLVALAGAAAPYIVVGVVRRPAATIGLGGAVSAVVGYVISRSTIFDFAFERFSDFEDEARTSRWELALEVIRESPLVGHGFGTSDEVGFGVHNTFLSIWIELGSLGLLLWVAAILTVVWTAIRTVRVATGTAEGLAVLALSWIGVSLAGALVESKLYRPTNLPAFVLVAAFALAHVQRQKVAQRLSTAVTASRSRRSAVEA